MTNSIASSKCPSVLTSGNYGMSKNRYTDDSKEYIFVKLTDSAYRAVEEYQRNESARRFLQGQRAKIQFIGNSGVIHFPTPDSGDNTTGGGGQFGFAVDDVEGSLECIQQHQNELDVLGSLSYRMRIHANDDVYDTTRTKMAIAEETEKSKCIREIKPNQTDIGRKVKKPPLSFNHHNNNNQQQQHHQHHQQLQQQQQLSGGHMGNSSSNISSSHNRMRTTTTTGAGVSPIRSSSATGSVNSSGVKLVAPTTSSRSPNPTTLGGSGTVNNTHSNRYGGNSGSYTSSVHSPLSSSNSGGGVSGGNVVNGNISGGTNSFKISSMDSLISASSLSSALADGIANGYASASTGVLESTSKRLKLGGSPNFRGADPSSSISGSKSLFGSSASINGSKGSCTTSNGKLQDISRRKIRERLIHLLALKPFKKPELYARLQNEGLRDRERQLISSILKDISTMSRDNTYNLRHQMWNDVNENWPYYTEQELQLLKRRKPQNLTPPLSSDAGSSTSGQSPTSTHTGSPPPLVGNLLSENGNNNLKRNNGDNDRFDEALLSSVQVKKQRISHYRKDSLAPTMANSNYGNSKSNFNSGSGNAAASSTLGKSTSYSPSRPSAAHNNGDEHFGDTDISYRILENADDFMSHLERNNASYGNRNSSGSNSSVNRKINNNQNTTGGNSNAINKTSSPFNERNENGNNNNSSSTNNNNSSSNSNNSRDKFRKSYTSGNSPSTAAAAAAAATTTTTAATYGGTFVAETKSSNSNNSGSSSSRNNLANGNSGSHIQRQSQSQSPSYAQQQNHKSNNSGKIGSINNSNNNNNNNTVGKNGSNNNGNSNNNSNSSGSGSGNIKNKNSASGKIYSPRSSSNLNSNSQRDESTQRMPSNSSSSRFHNKSSRTPTPPMRQNVPTNESAFSQNEQQNSHQNAFNQLQQQLQLQQQQQLQLQQPQEQQHSSPTQQIADAVSNYASHSASDKRSYDFSNYTPITTIEQRRRYKTEFENDYDEYLKLLKQVENVGERFRGLAVRLENARRGHPEFNAIKQQIVSEYERIRNADTLKRDKERFDYLHEKLAYIKQLVTDYDRTLTSGGNNSNSGNSTNLSLLRSPRSDTTSQQQQQLQIQHQQQQLQQQQQQQQLHYRNQNQQEQQGTQHNLHQHPRQYHQVCPDVMQRHEAERGQQLHHQQQSQTLNTSPLHNTGVDEHFISTHQRHLLSSDAIRTHNAHTNVLNSNNMQNATNSDSDDSSDSNDDSNDDDDDDDDDDEDEGNVEGGGNENRNANMNVNANVNVNAIANCNDDDDDEDDDDDDSYSNSSNDDDNNGHY